MRSLAAIAARDGSSDLSTSRDRSKANRGGERSSMDDESLSARQPRNAREMYDEIPSRLVYMELRVEGFFSWLMVTL